MSGECEKHNIESDKYTVHATLDTLKVATKLLCKTIKQQNNHMIYFMAPSCHLRAEERRCLPKKVKPAVRGKRPGSFK